MSLPESAAREATLRVENLTALYGPVPAVRDVSFFLGHGKTLGLIGPNGSGKSTLLKAIAGLVTARGRITIGDRSMDALSTAKRYRLGLSFVPQEKMVIGGLTVYENIKLSWLLGRRLHTFEDKLEAALQLFPQLRSKLSSLAANLSGGQRQMLAVSRGLALDAEVMMLDEPTAGLAPVMVQELSDAMAKLRDQGLTLLIVEQNFMVATSLCEHIMVMAGGEICWHGEASKLERDTATNLYLGGEKPAKNQASQ
jgi:branched-chain amino acid transport system ATP-binding protein